jgi:transcription antitermination factor NusG
MSNNDRYIDQLIDKLQALHVETTTIIDAITLARQEEIAHKRQLQTNGSGTKATGDPAAIERTFRVGDRVSITNSPFLKHSRKGIVTRLSGNRVYLRTDDNVTTWRLAKNLRYT